MVNKKPLSISCWIFCQFEAIKRPIIHNLLNFLSLPIADTTFFLFSTINSQHAENDIKRAQKKRNQTIYMFGLMYILINKVEIMITEFLYGWACVCAVFVLERTGSWAHKHHVRYIVVAAICFCSTRSLEKSIKKTFSTESKASKETTPHIYRLATLFAYCLFATIIIIITHTNPPIYSYTLNAFFSFEFYLLSSE